MRMFVFIPCDRDDEKHGLGPAFPPRRAARAPLARRTASCEALARVSLSRALRPPQTRVRGASGLATLRFASPSTWGERGRSPQTPQRGIARNAKGRVRGA